MTSKIPSPELLAPLSNWKSLEPQTNILRNADAFYFGLDTNFSMRARADNFSIDDLTKLVTTIHEAHRKCYLTTNILIYNTELVELHQTIQLAKDAGVDALICHDLATIMIAKQVGIPFHISTQANISNKIAAKFYESLGAERLILAREVNLEDIKDIVSEVSIPVECFVHGAMCTAVSGRCYLSADLMQHNSEFSANRGKCVQPCRRYFTFQGEEGELLDYDQFSGMFFNAKDLCMIGHIPELIEAGIASFKIEGRMRDPLYLTEVVGCYREAISSYYENTYTQEKVDKWLNKLTHVFNRGFHTGYYFNRPNIEDIEKNVRGNISTWQKKQIGKVTNYYRKAMAIEIDLFDEYLHEGQEIVIENRSSFFHKQIITSLQLEGALVEETPMANRENHIIVGIKVDRPVPINALVYIMENRSKPKIFPKKDHI
ncbi:peptidase U32 family protein [Candidatus Lokiarchaeum ossiferum]|uniref:peptidase U32 family protein n=1 Tax=Candidatus Lokiarchaeum ossiferum TaxID=2951803 RepID=UPI00352C65FB